ncbi:MAG: ABC transporter substrate-binding protein [Proteobacteria bacterium]|nr:ABC transporter substrate-binding protein [Pseudomonadota bacterium]MBS0548247.1 ABC transporter substrate-binding protein [Pseudomonadota bacterium]
MVQSGNRGIIRRRRVLQVGAGIGALQFASPFIIQARGEQSVKIGMIDPLTGAYAAVARSEVEGAKLALDQVNAKGGILGRKVELLVEDSANDVGIGVQKARKLIEGSGANFIFGDVNSAIALAVAQVTAEKKVLHIVTGGHSDAVTGTDCHWNVFRVCNSTVMDGNAIAGVLMSKFGKKWYFLTPDYAYGHSVQAALVKQLEAAGGKWQGSLTPIGTPDYSALLIKAKAYKPDVIVNVMGGGDQVNSIKQYVQFGLAKQIPMGGTLFEYESVAALPDDARSGWWTYEWYWNQPKTPHVADFVAEVKKRTNQVATARHWFGYVGVHTVALVSNQEKTLEAPKLAKALEGFKLPPEVALTPNPAIYRAGDHQLMSDVFVGQAHPKKAGGDPNDFFEVTDVVPGEKAAGPVAGCVLKYPA